VWVFSPGLPEKMNIVKEYAEISEQLLQLGIDVRREKSLRKKEKKRVKKLKKEGTLDTESLVGVFGVSVSLSVSLSVCQKNYCLVGIARKIMQKNECSRKQCVFSTFLYVDL